MELVVNGQMVDGRCRIDDLEAGLDGLEFLNNPWAIAKDMEAATLIVEAVNKYQKEIP